MESAQEERPIATGEPAPTVPTLEERGTQRYRPSAALGFDPLQLPQMLADAIAAAPPVSAAAPAAGPRQSQLLRSSTVYQSAGPAPLASPLTRAASTSTAGVTLIRSRLNWEPVPGESPVYFHKGLNEWREFPIEETAEGEASSTSPLRKRDRLRKFLSLKLKVGKGNKQKKDRTISSPVEGSVRYNEL